MTKNNEIEAFLIEETYIQVVDAWNKNPDPKNIKFKTPNRLSIDEFNDPDVDNSVLQKALAFRNGCVLLTVNDRSCMITADSAKKLKKIIET